MLPAHNSVGVVGVSRHRLAGMCWVFAGNLVAAKYADFNIEIMVLAHPLAFLI